MRNGQIIKGMGGERIAQSQGICVVCLRTTWGFVDDVAPDPRGPFGLASAAPLDARDYDRIGDDVPVCYGCRQVGDSYQRALAIAKAKWVQPVFLMEVKDSNGAWRAVHPTGGSRYEYATEREALAMLEMCYPDQIYGEEVRVKKEGAV